MSGVSRCRSHFWGLMKGTLMTLPKGVSHWTAMTDVRYCLAPERCLTSTASLSPIYGCALSVERELATPLTPRKGNGQDEDSWEDGRGRA